MQDALLRFSIPAVVATAVGLDVLASRARESIVRNAQLRYTISGDDCHVECSRDMAVIVATAILTWASQHGVDARIDADPAMSTIVALLRDQPITVDADPDRDRLCS